MLKSTHKKLREARFFLDLLNRDVTESMLDGPEDGDFLLSAYLTAARAVTFALQKETGGGEAYRTWFDSWYTRLHSDDQALLTLFKEQRNKAEKEGGAELQTVTTTVSLDEFLQEYSSRVHLTGTQYVSEPQSGAPRPNISLIKSEPRFTALPHESVTDVCRRNLELLVRLVRDYQMDHQPPPVS